MRVFKLASSFLLLASVVASKTKNIAQSSGLNLRQKAVLPKQSVTAVKTIAPIPKAIASKGGAVAASQKNAVAAVVVMTLIERSMNKIFRANGIAFPSMLGGCIALFAFLLLAQLGIPGLGDSISTALNPGGGLITKWLPSFFVPALAVLPLAPSVGGGLEVCVTLRPFLLVLSFCIYLTLFINYSIF
jgi:hypothetical protein